jgi:hypothetical protein
MNPSQGDKFVTHVENVAKALAIAGAKADSSCGLHCHVSADDLGWFDLYKLCKLYAKIEPGIYSIIAPSRRESRYAKECSDDYTFDSFKDFKTNLLERLYGISPDKKRGCKYDTTRTRRADSSRGRVGRGHKHGHDMKYSNDTVKVLSVVRDKYNSARYRGLNLHSFFYRRTVEFRHHHGTVNGEKMMYWGILCAGIVDAANRLNISQIDALPSGFEGLQSIFEGRTGLLAWMQKRKDKFKGRDMFYRDSEGE